MREFGLLPIRKRFFLRVRLRKPIVPIGYVCSILATLLLIVSFLVVNSSVDKELLQLVPWDASWKRLNWDNKGPCPRSSLRHVVSAGGIMVDPGKVQEVTSRLTPRRLKETWNDATGGLEEEEALEVGPAKVVVGGTARPRRELRRSFVSLDAS